MIVLINDRHLGRLAGCDHFLGGCTGVWRGVKLLGVQQIGPARWAYEAVATGAFQEMPAKWAHHCYSPP